jgi:RNA polymerase sigma factor (sigma-70 family)
MEDPEIVAAIVFGDPEGLAEAYDRYAVPLYAYCCSMLREPADAADAVQDTFLIAAAKLPGLRDPAKLRPWLYAVARRECLRRLRARPATARLEEAADVPAESAGVGREAERADLQELVRDAIDGLNPGERDVIELSLSHQLEGEDLADVLGVSRNHAHALLSRARSQLERSLGALIVARTGRQACPALDSMLAGWDGQLTVLMRKRISRHIEECESCGDRKRRELTPALYAGMTPLVAVLPGFRDQLLRSLADRTPAGTAARLSAADHAGRFGPSGFPRPLRVPGASAWHQAIGHPRVPLQHSNAVVASAATSVMAAGAIAAVVIGGPHGPSAAAGARAGTTHSAATSTGPQPAHDGPAGRSEAGLVPSTSGSAGPTAPVPANAATSGSATSPTGPSPVAATSPSATSPSATSPSAGSSAAPTVSQGTLAISTRTLDLATVNGTASGKFTITAKGGPVSDYSITVGSALAGKLTVSPSSGSLAAGASATVTVTSTSLIALDGQLTVNPGGQAVTIVLSVGL